MAFWKDLQKGLYQRKLKQADNAPNIKRQAISLDGAKEIGILFDAKEEATRKMVLNYAAELKRSRKKVTLLAYFDGKELPAGISFPCFCNQDLGMNMTPTIKAEKVQVFIKQPFDLLLSLHTDSSLPLEYISVVSHARFRVGAYRADNTNPYDLMVENKSKSIRALIKQMETYLNKMK